MMMSETPSHGTGHAQNHAEERTPRGASHRGGLPRIRRRVLVACLVTLLLVCVGAAVLVWYPRVVASSSATDTPQSVMDRISVSGRVGATPVLRVDLPLEIRGTKHRVVTRGEGRVIRSGDPVLLAVTSFNGADGKMLTPSGHPRILIGTAAADSIGADLAREVVGHAEGTRLLVVRRTQPTEENTPSSSPTTQAGSTPIPAYSSEIEVLDILPSLADGQASGTASSSAAPLTVTLGDEGPVISHGADLPAGPTLQPLVTGAGAQVRSDDDVIAQFIVTGWSDGQERESTWRTGTPQRVRMSDIMPGLRQLLVDQRVGSRLAITIPPDQATGDDTLCVVIDILATEPSSASS